MYSDPGFKWLNSYLPQVKQQTLNTHKHNFNINFCFFFLIYRHYYKLKLFLEVLNYSIHSSSGYSASYTPNNIKVNCPSDQASRWSSASNDQNQFLILEILDDETTQHNHNNNNSNVNNGLALLESIGFGKFHKGTRNSHNYCLIIKLNFLIVHVCNLKEFKVFAGPSLDSLHLILHIGLNNDTIPESFPPNYSLSSLPDKLSFPVKFVKIVPMAAWGSNFNFSIWYIELRGWTDGGGSSGLVKAALDEYNRVKEEETTRLVLKFLRQHRHSAAFDALQNDSPVKLEDPLVTQLHLLINQNRLIEAESLLIDLYNKDNCIFNQYLHDNVPYEVHWTRL